MSDKQGERVLLSFILGCLIGTAFSTIYVMATRTRNQEEGINLMRQEAIEAGVAEWVLVDEPGPDAEFEFRWLEKEELTPTRCR